MRLGLNLLYLIPGKVGGTETYARELVRALILELKPSDRLIIYCGREAAVTFESSRQVRVVTMPVHSTNRPLRMLVEQCLLPFQCMYDRLDLIFSLGYSAPFLHSCPSVVTIHDLNWHYHPEDFSLGNRLMWRLITTLSARFSSHVITDSSASAESLRSVLRIRKTKITPILHGVPTRITVPKARRKPYILTVVAGYPHKNLQTLLQAFASIHKLHPSLELVVCGLSGKSDTQNEGLIRKLGISRRVSSMGYVTREELAALYQGAKVFVFPSAYEGFGYPVLEAMSYGVPVISSRAFSLTEVVGNGGILVDTYDTDEYAKSIHKVLSSDKLRRELLDQGKKRVSELQWASTAKQTRQVLERHIQ